MRYSGSVERLTYTRSDGGWRVYVKFVPTEQDRYPKSFVLGVSVSDWEELGRFVPNTEPRDRRVAEAISETAHLEPLLTLLDMEAAKNWLREGKSDPGPA